jgi:DNA-binding SARP family transcriptional activator
MSLPATASRIDDPVSLDLIRGFELRCGPEIVSVPMSSQRLIAFVALHDRAVRRSFVSGMLWLDSSTTRANASLRSALWRTPSLGGAPLVEASSTHIWLDPRVEVDFRTTVGRAMSLLDEGPTGALDPAELVRELSRFGEDLLPDWYDDWVLVERERFRQLRLHALEQICERLTEAGRYGQALQAGLAAVAAEPVRESAHRLVVRVHLAEGNLSEAARAYEAYAWLLDRELGARPSDAMERLVAGLVRAPVG